VELLTVADLGLAPELVGEAGSPTRVLSIRPIAHERRCRFLEGEPAKIADQLMDHLIEKGFIG
jgi:electron transfer flavoprotein beta subunit